MLKKGQRLVATSDFRRIYRQGVSVASDHLVLYYLPSNNGVRVGLSVSKKLGSSVTRNRIKRLLRAACSRALPLLRGSYDIVIIARAPVLGLDYGATEKVVREIFERSGLMGG